MDLRDWAFTPFGVLVYLGSAVLLLIAALWLLG